jgi:hypothetical protein
MGKNQIMNREDFQIFLKLADGTFHPLVSAKEKRRAKLSITTAHNRQKKAVFEFYARNNSETGGSIESRVAQLELDLGEGSTEGSRDLALSVELDLFDNLSISVADPVSGTLKTAEVSLSEWLLSKESPLETESVSQKRGITPLKVIFLVLFILVSTGLVLFGAWFLASNLSSPPPPPLSSAIQSGSGEFPL